MVKELICCLVLLLLTAVLYRICHGFLTAEKGTVEFSHTKDYTGKRLLLCCWMPPWWDQVVLGRGPCIFTRHLKLIKELWLELIWCSPYEWPACGLASVYETTVNTNRCAWVNSFDHLTSREAKSMINISDASSRPTCLWITLCGPAVGCAVNYKALILCSIDLS